MDYTNKTITLEDGIKYVVVEQVNYNNNIYLYITNSNNVNETRFVEIKDDEVLLIEPTLFKEKILPLFIEKLIKQ